MELKINSDLPVGETFGAIGNKYKVVEGKEGTCSGCSFLEQLYCHEFDRPNCNGDNRSDGIDVIFYEIG